MEDLDWKTIIFRLTGRQVPGREHDIKVYLRNNESGRCIFSYSVNISRNLGPKNVPNFLV